MDAHALPKSVHLCGIFCRQGLEAGGLDTRGHPNEAKNYGPFLLRRGARKVAVEGYVPTKGDIAVFAGSAKHKHGHIEIFDGKQWISDYRQRRFSPYSEKSAPSYEVYTASLILD